MSSIARLSRKSSSVWANSILLAFQQDRGFVATQFRMCPTLSVSTHNEVYVNNCVTIWGLFPAKALTWLPEVRQMHGRRSVAYVHLLFDCHEVVIAECAPTTSLYPGGIAKPGPTLSASGKVILPK
ncbi:Hint domain-containing protein [Phaeobacter sp. JH20_09]|uniref:Hint domain-containing protein n=1 Tax=unclassified Phaeobacter TaxID=2621772 RepID=UPI003A8BA27A